MPHADLLLAPVFLGGWVAAVVGALVVVAIAVGGAGVGRLVGTEVVGVPIGAELGTDRVTLTEVVVVATATPNGDVALIALTVGVGPVMGSVDEINWIDWPIGGAIPGAAYVRLIMTPALSTTDWAEPSGLPVPRPVHANVTPALNVSDPVTNS